MASTAAQLAALGNDQAFQMRVRSIVLQVAAQVYNETPVPPDDKRRAFARQMLANSDAAQRLAVPIANTTNLIAGNTTYDFEAAHVVSDVSDAALFAQITAAWDLLAGV
jgi:hypothetical protein